MNKQALERRIEDLRVSSRSGLGEFALADILALLIEIREHQLRSENPGDQGR